MRLIPFEELVPDVEYYIESSVITSLPKYSGRYSGKTIGTFVRLNYERYGTYAEFRNVHNLPGARLPSGPVNRTEMRYDVSIFNFYLPENEKLMLTSVMRSKMNEDYFKPEFGGKIKKTKYRKSLKKRNKKNKKTNKRRRT